MGFKPMTKYFTAFEISKTKAYKILKESACGISMQKAYNILAFMGLIDTLNCNTKFLSSNIKRESFTNSGFDGIQTHDNAILPASEISKKKAYEILKRACGISKEKVHTCWGSNP